MHDTVVETCLKTLFQEDIPYELLVHTVVGFSKIELEQDTLPLGALQLMYNLKERIFPL